MTRRAGEGPAFPRMRWAAAAWLCLWLPAYSHYYPLSHFLALCDLAVVLTCIGLWRGDALVLSSQAVSSLVVDSAWALDVLWRLLLGHHLIGGTEYMWGARWPLQLRLLSLFHVLWPALLLWALRRVGYDRRGLALQSAIAAAAMAAARMLDPGANLDFVLRDPFLHRSIGPAPLHVTLMIAGLVLLIYLPTHVVLSRLYPPPRKA